MSYSPEQTEYMVRAYTESPCRATVDALAEQFNKSAKSVIGKLSREGVYRREIYKTKTGDDPITKAEIVEHIANKLNTTSERLSGLEKTPKLTLKYLESLLVPASQEISQ